jgi:SAM-dependent methyltransferase
MALLDRLAGQPIISEFDLAIDRGQELTDQNHIGGFESTVALAESIQLDRHDAVVDFGCGLGGPARVLAAIYGCHVHGIDVNENRIAQAKRLSALVGLADKVSFSVGDITKYVSAERISVIWAQNSWIHFADPGIFQRLARPLRSPSTRIAFEDVCQIRDCGSSEERSEIARLGEVWSCRFCSPHDWVNGMQLAGFRAEIVKDDRDGMISYLDRLSRLSSSSIHNVPAHEVLGWQLGKLLAQQGLISYVRIIGSP